MLLLLLYCFTSRLFFGEGAVMYYLLLFLQGRITFIILHPGSGCGKTPGLATPKKPLLLLNL